MRARIEADLIGAECDGAARALLNSQRKDEERTPAEGENLNLGRSVLPPHRTFITFPSLPRLIPTALSPPSGPLPSF